MGAVVRARLLRERVPALTTAQAKTLAAGLPAPRDTQAMSWHDLAEHFAQLVLDGWSADRAVELGKKYDKAPGTRPLGDWMRIAGQVVDKPDAAAEFARMGGGWSRGGVARLASQFDRVGGAGQQVLWARIGGVGGHLRDQPDDVAQLARLAGWQRGNVIALAGLYAVAPVPRPLDDWIAIATGVPGLADRENEVAGLAGVHGQWTQAGLVRLAGAFAADAGGRAVAEWAALAMAHAMFGDRERAVAAAARARWTALELGQACTAGLAATATAQMLGDLLSKPLAATQLRAMMTIGGWSAANVGTFAGTLLVAGVPLAKPLDDLLTTQRITTALQAMIVAGWTAADVATFAGALLRNGVGVRATTRCLATGGFAAAAMNMRASWTPVELADFIRGSILQGTRYADLTTLMATLNFPASSHTLIAGTWGASHVGEFCGRAVRAGATGLVMHGLCSSANAGLGLRAMTTANWAHGDLGTFVAAVLAGGISAATLVSLMRRAPFPRGSKRMHDEHWRPRLNGEFVVGALNRLLPEADLAALVDEANFARDSHLWLTPGWTAREIGQMAGRALVVHTPPPAKLTRTRLTAFLGTANAATTAHTLHTIVPAWTADELGETIGFVLTRVGGPSDGEMERLLFRAQSPINGAQIQPVYLRRAADARRVGAPGRIPPTWASVITHTPTFQANWRGPRANTNGGQATWGSAFGPYNIRLRVVAERINHVEKGHHFKYFEFTYANCTRAGVGENGNCSFLPANANVKNILNGLLGDGTVRGLAENAAWNANNPGGPSYGTQGATAGYVVACASMAANYGTASAIISQCYPTVGTPIVGRDLVAIGRFFGLIA